MDIWTHMNESNCYSLSRFVANLFPVKLIKSYVSNKFVYF